MSPWVSEGLAKRPLRDVLIKHLVNLCRIFSPSGYELGVIEYCLPILKESGFDVNVSPEGNIYAVRGKTESGKYILLNAHTDTVQGNDDAAIMVHPDVVQYDPFWNIIWGHGHMVGGDDKCGIGIVLALAEATDTPMKVLLTVREESGCTGVDAVPKEFYKDATFCFTLDRRNCCDLIETYSGRKLAPKGLVDLILTIAKESKVSMTVADGSFADTHAISEHVPAVNMSVGYYNAHSSYDFIRVNETYDTLMILRRCFERQNEFETEWARTPVNWRPAVFPLVKRVYYDNYGFYGSLYGATGDVANDWEYKDRVNYSLDRYKKIDTKKSRKQAETEIKEEKEEKKEEEKKEEVVSPQRYSIAELIAKDDKEPVLRDPFGSTYGDLIWAERYNAAWEAQTAYPRVKIEKKWQAATYVPIGDAYPKSKARKYPEIIPSSVLIPDEGGRLIEIVSILLRTYPTYIAPSSNRVIHSMIITIGPPDNSDMLSGILGWMKMESTPPDPSRPPMWLPMLPDAGTVYEISMIYEEHPDTDLGYKIASLAADVATRIEDTKERSGRYQYRELSSAAYNSMIDMMAFADRMTTWFKSISKPGMLFEASATKQPRVDGWNSIGSVSIFRVFPPGPELFAAGALAVGAVREFEEEFFVYGDYKSLMVLKNLYYKKLDDQFDSMMDSLIKGEIADIESGKSVLLPVAPLKKPVGEPIAAIAESSLTIDDIEEIATLLTFSYSPETRKKGFPWRLREAARTFRLDPVAAGEFLRILAHIGTFTLNKPDGTHVTTVRYNLTYHGGQNFKNKTPNLIQPLMPIGSSSETPKGGVATSYTYHDTLGSVLDVYNDLGISSYDWVIASDRPWTGMKSEQSIADEAASDRVEAVIAEVEELAADAVDKLFEEWARMMEASEGVETDTPGTIQAAPSASDYSFAMPFFREDGTEMISSRDFANFAKKHKSVRLTSEEISLLTAGISNYADLLKTSGAQDMVSTDPKDRQEVEIIAYHINPSAEHIASIGVVDPQTKEYIDGWSVTPTLGGLATMYFRSNRIAYESAKVGLVVNYFNTIAFYVVLRVKHNVAITYDHEKQEFSPPLPVFEVPRKKKKTKAEKKAEKKARKEEKRLATRGGGVSVERVGGKVHDLGKLLILQGNIHEIFEVVNRDYRKQYQNQLNMKSKISTSANTADVVVEIQPPTGYPVDVVVSTLDRDGVPFSIPVCMIRVGGMEVGCNVKGLERALRGVLDITFPFVPEPKKRVKVDGRVVSETPPKMMIGAESPPSRALEDPEIKMALHEYLMDLTVFLSEGYPGPEPGDVHEIKSSMGNYLSLVTHYTNINKVDVGDHIGDLIQKDAFGHAVFTTSLYLSEGSLRSLLGILNTSNIKKMTNVPMTRLSAILVDAEKLGKVMVEYESRKTPAEGRAAEEFKSFKKEKKEKREKTYRFDSEAYKDTDRGRGSFPKRRRGATEHEYSPP